MHLRKGEEVPQAAKGSKVHKAYRTPLVPKGVPGGSQCKGSSGDSWDFLGGALSLPPLF